MNTYANISRELKSFFSANKVFKILLPIDMVFLFAGLIIMFLDDILNINFGSLIYNIAYWAFILGLLLVYANMKEMFLYIGLLGYAAICILYFIINLIAGGHYFSWGSLFETAIYGGLGYLVFRRSVTTPANTNVNS